LIVKVQTIIAGKHEKNELFAEKNKNESYGLVLFRKLITIKNPYDTMDEVKFVMGLG